MSEVCFRVLEADEQEDVLDLLDLWPFRDGRRGREFFARSMQWDPRYAPENFWIAEHGGEILSCVQVFPRWIRVRGQPVPTAGIGSVFTRPEARRQGVAEGLLAAVVEGLLERGFELSLLWASRVGWYEKLGWARWGGEMFELLPADGEVAVAVRGAGPEIERFDEEGHLAAVEELASLYDQERSGTVVRNRADWQGNLQLAGEPHEEFVVTRPIGDLQLTSFLRGTVLGDRWTATQWAHDGTVEGVRDLALVMATLRHAMGIEALRVPALRDPALERALAEQGLRVRQLSRLWQAPEGPEPAPSFWFLRALQPEALADRFFGSPDAAPGSSEFAEEEALLEALAPRSGFCFWPADRF